MRMDQLPLPGEWADLLWAPGWSGQQSGPVWVSWAPLAGHFISIAHPATHAPERVLTRLSSECTARAPGAEPGGCQALAQPYAFSQAPFC